MRLAPLMLALMLPEGVALAGPCKSDSDCGTGQVCTDQKMQDGKWSEGQCKPESRPHEEEKQPAKDTKKAGEKDEKR